MNMIYDDGRVIRYRGNLDNSFFEVEYNKFNKSVKIILDSSLLKNNNYEFVFGKIYKSVVIELKDIRRINFEFHPKNEREIANSKAILNKYNIKGKSNIVVNNNNNLTTQNQKVRKEVAVENYFKAKMVAVNDNGKIVNRIIRPKNSVSNEYVLDNININDLKTELDLAVKEDPTIVNLSEEEVAIIVIDRLEKKRKKHSLESKDKISPINEKAEITYNAAGKDAKINTELGMVMNDPAENLTNSFKSVETNGGNYSVVNSSVNEITGNSVNIGTSYTTQSDFGSEEIETRDEETVYYLDDTTGEIYNKNEEVIGMIGSEYAIDYNDNYLIKKTGDKTVKMGPVDDIKNLGKSNNLDKAKVRVLEKPSDLDNAAFVNINSFVVLITILSVMAIFLYLISK